MPVNTASRVTQTSNPTSPVTVSSAVRETVVTSEDTQSGFNDISFGQEVTESQLINPNERKEDSESESEEDNEEETNEENNNEDKKGEANQNDNAKQSRHPQGSNENPENPHFTDDLTDLPGDDIIDDLEDIEDIVNEVEEQVEDQSGTQSIQIRVVN